MENLSINATAQNKQVPQVNLNAESGKGTICGESYHENAMFLYDEINTWIDEYFKSNDTFSLSLGINYFNTTSSKGIYTILSNLKQWTLKNKIISIVWYISENDDDLHEDIEELSEDVEIHISVIMSDSKHQIAS